MKWMLLVLAVVLLLTIGEQTLARWMPGIAGVPLTLPLALSTAFLLSHRALFRVTLVAGIAAELGSGMTPGLAFAVTVLLPHVLRTVLRRPRPDLPLALRVGVVALLTLAILLAFNLPVGTGDGSFGVRLLAVRVLLPSLFAAGVAASASALLRRPAGAALLTRLDALTP